MIDQDIDLKQAIIKILIKNKLITGIDLEEHYLAVWDSAQEIVAKVREYDLNHSGE